MATRIELTLVLADGSRWKLPPGNKASGKTTFTIKPDPGALVAVKSIEARTVQA